MLWTASGVAMVDGQRVCPHGPALLTVIHRSPLRRRGQSVPQNGNGRPSSSPRFVLISSPRCVIAVKAPRGHFVNKPSPYWESQSLSLVCAEPERLSFCPFTALVVFRLHNHPCIAEPVVQPRNSNKHCQLNSPRPRPQLQVYCTSISRPPWYPTVALMPDIWMQTRIWQDKTRRGETRQNETRWQESKCTMIVTHKCLEAWWSSFRRRDETKQNKITRV